MAVLFLIHYLTHPRRKNPLVQAALLMLSVACGCYVVHSVNETGYFAIMKRTPALGTLWVWSVLEMELWLDLLSCALVCGFTWWGEYGVF